MTSDAERLRAMAALLGEVAAVLPAGSLRTVVEATLVDYRTSRPDTRTGLGRGLSPGWEPKRAGSIWTCTHKDGGTFDCWPPDDEPAWERHDERESAACEKHAESMGVFADAAPPDEGEDDSGPSCGCSDEDGPCDRHNGMNEDDGPNQHEADQSLRDSGRGHLVRP